jgi:hypothetical protein
VPVPGNTSLLFALHECAVDLNAMSIASVWFKVLLYQSNGIALVKVIST